MVAQSTIASQHREMPVVETEVRATKRKSRQELRTTRRWRPPTKSAIESTQQR